MPVSSSGEQKPVLLLDLGGVVLGIDFHRVFQHWASASGVKASLFYEHWTLDQAYKDQEIGQLNFAQYTAHLSDTLGVSMPLKQWRDGWNALWTHPYEGVAAKFKEIKQHFTLCAFSNTNAVHAESFMQRYPRVLVDLELQDTVTDLTAQRIDLALRFASNPDPSLIGKPIALCESVLVASPEYLKRRGVPQEPEDLQQHDCLGYRNFGRHVWNLHHDTLGNRAVDMHCRLTANEVTALMTAAELGMGIALQPTYMVSKLLQSGALVTVLPQWRPEDLKIYVLYASRKHQSKAVRTLIDYLDDWFKQNPW